MIVMASASQRTVAPTLHNIAAAFPANLKGLSLYVSSASASSPWELAPSLRSALPSLISIDARGDEELLGDLALGAARGGQRGDAALARGQRGHAVRLAVAGSTPTASISVRIWRSRRSAPHTSASSCARVSGSRA